ncbi:MAG TPA: rhodanese-like domain-containing protein [Gemmatimonadales bacterium]|jgi:rhodanese-related sulfurtransferase|nr:rhodanese-like domain-containing protein [Gemmatimonadales bacterium]
MRGWVKVLLIMILLPILIGGVVLLVAGRPAAFEILQRRTAARFPEIRWITTDQLATWQGDTLQPQPLLLDARTEQEYRISHLKGALPIDPYRPSLNSLRGVPQDSAIVVYSSAGYRGARVASWLAKSGYTTVVNLAGGLFKWANEDRPLFRDLNRPTAMVHPYDQRWGYLVEGRYRAQAPDVEKHSAAP